LKIFNQALDKKFKFPDTKGEFCAVTDTFGTAAGICRIATGAFGTPTGICRIAAGAAGTTTGVCRIAAGACGIAPGIRNGG